MPELFVVDENDNVISTATYEEVHSCGLRHRSANVFHFNEPQLETMLVSQRSR